MSLFISVHSEIIVSYIIEKLCVKFFIKSIPVLHYPSDIVLKIIATSIGGLKPYLSDQTMLSLYI